MTKYRILMKSKEYINAESMLNFYCGAVYEFVALMPAKALCH